MARTRAVVDSRWGISIKDQSKKALLIARTHGRGCCALEEPRGLGAKEELAVKMAIYGKLCTWENGWC